MQAGARAPKIAAAPIARPVQHTVRNNHHRVSVCAARQARVVFWTLASFLSTATATVSRPVNDL